MDTVTSSNDSRIRPLWKSAPPPIGWRLAATDSLMLAPAIAGATFGWSWSLTWGLMLPGFILQVRLTQTAARTQGIPRWTNEIPLRTQVILIGVPLLAAILAESILPTHLLALALVLDLIVIVDPGWRIAWHRTRASTSH
jgi:hypothetical protein